MVRGCFLYIETQMPGSLLKLQYPFLASIDPNIPILFDLPYVKKSDRFSHFVIAMVLVSDRLTFHCLLVSGAV